MTSPSMLVAPNVPRDANLRLSGENSKVEEDNIFECFQAPVQPVLFVCKKPCAENQILYPIFHIVSRCKKVDTENGNSSCILILKRKSHRLGCTNGVPALSPERGCMCSPASLYAPDVRECETRAKSTRKGNQ